MLVKLDGTHVVPDEFVKERIEYTIAPSSAIRQIEILTLSRTLI